MNTTKYKLIKKYLNLSLGEIAILNGRYYGNTAKGFIGTKEAIENDYEHWEKLPQYTLETGNWYVGKYIEDTGERAYIYYLGDNNISWGFDWNGKWTNTFKLVNNLEYQMWELVNINRIKLLLLRKCTNDYEVGTIINQTVAYNGSGECKYTIKSGNIEVDIKDKNINVSVDDYGIFNTRFGVWADIIKTPLFEDIYGNFWYKDDFKQNEVYYIELTDNTKYLLKFNTTNNNEMFGTAAINLLENTYYIDGLKIFTDPISVTRIATQDEIDWLERCKKAGKYIPRYKVGTNEINMFMLLKYIFGSDFDIDIKNKDKKYSISEHAK